MIKLFVHIASGIESFVDYVGLTKTWVRFLVGVLVLLTGCVTPYEPHGSVVTIRQPHSIGAGVVIGENLVITAAHVVDEDGYIKIRVSKNPLMKHTEFFKLAEIDKLRENIVCLYGPFDFSPTAIFKLGCEKNDKPFMIQTRRGLFELTNFNSQPGDSGSAVICKHGRLLGVHWGHQSIMTITNGKKVTKRTKPIFLLFKD